ncbi:Hypothetical predicted protein [Octopus vulgaris]|uniref:Uncharacterized protein n=1 Tax=Octopus vulgaris TaxID=6645 RepID=A0AA36FHY7_OCTVU|nr:Hypothetical predicted protein [Octopus vulgaris]
MKECVEQKLSLCFQQPGNLTCIIYPKPKLRGQELLEVADNIRIIIARCKALSSITICATGKAMSYQAEFFIE